MMGVLRWLATVIVYGAVLFALAGRIDLPWVWAYWAAGALGSAGLAVTIDPDLARERSRPGPGGVDRLRRFVFAAAVAVHLAVALLDAGQFHWSDTVPGVLRAFGLLGYAAGLTLLVWAVTVNRFYSPVVRIQTERGHHLVTRGPYRLVRHPGYVAVTLLMPCSALAIGSWWALAPALAVSLLVVHRVIIEDRFLHANLAGYPAYAANVRYRLIPGIW
jgi:protein-S-isoprenylcysteine O-methyltransferase Ste14